MNECFAGVIDDEYIQKRYNIGKVHSEIGLDLKWYLATYTKYVEIIYKHISPVLPNEAINILLAIHALFSFDMQLTLEAYEMAEIEKAAHPLRYELHKLQQVNGFTEQDLQHLDEFSGYISFRVDAIMEAFRQSFSQRLWEEYSYSFLNE